jgi:hypothetical protein
MELSISESNGVDIVCVPKEAQEALQKKWQAMEESEIVPKEVKSKEIVCKPEKEREPILGILSDRERNYCDEEKVFDKNLKRKTIKYMKVEKLQLAYENAENKAQEVIVMLPVLICLPLGQVQTDAVLVEVMCMLGSNDVIGEICEGQENMFDEMPKRKFKLVNIFVLASIAHEAASSKIFCCLEAPMALEVPLWQPPWVPRTGTKACCTLKAW